MATKKRRATKKKPATKKRGAAKKRAGRKAPAGRKRAAKKKTGRKSAARKAASRKRPAKAAPRKSAGGGKRPASKPRSVAKQPAPPKQPAASKRAAAPRQRAASKPAAKPDMTGRFVWHELVTTDTKAAEPYYKKVIGWGTKPFEDADPSEPYTMWTAGQAPQGGLMDLPQKARDMGAPSHWLTYVGVADADKTADRVKKLGGAVMHGPVTIPKVGRFAVLRDPQGAVFAVIAGEGNPPMEPPTGPGTFSWHELSTSDADAAWRFYADLFGWKKTESMDMGEGNMYQMFGFKGAPSVGGMSKNTKVPPNWMPYVVVKDVDETVGRVKSSGGKIMLEPMEVPGGDRIAISMDPQGAALGVHQRAG